MNTECKKEFLLDQFADASIHAAFMWGRVYKQDKYISDKEKDGLKQTIKETLKRLASKYEKGSVDDGAHIRNLGRLQEDVANTYSSILAGNKIRLGTAQKILNLYLKYLWCTDWITTPPHCPFDSVVYEELRQPDREGMKEVPPFTKLTEEKHYKTLVERARKEAKRGQISSLSEWECRVWLKWKQRNNTQ